MIILNFSHPLTPAQIEQVRQISAQDITKVIDLPVQFDPTLSFTAQMKELLVKIPLTSAELQALPLLIVLPALNYIAALLIAELHGRMGYFPTILRLRPVSGSTPLQYEAAELLNLQVVRDNARLER